MKAAIRREMRRRITGALVLMMFMLFSIFAFDADAATRDEYVNRGEQKLYTESIDEMLQAHAIFDEAIIFYPDDPVINAYLAFTRMLYYALTSDSVGIPDLYEQYGVTRTGYNLDTLEHHLPKDDNGKYNVPVGAPTGETIRAYLFNTLLDAVDESISNLDVTILAWDPEDLNPDNRKHIAKIANTNRDSDLEIDPGDILLYSAGLKALKSFILVASAYNLDIDLREIAALRNLEALEINDVFLRYPEFLKLLTYSSDPPVNGSGLLDQARPILVEAIDEYLTASDEILNDPDTYPGAEELTEFDECELRMEKWLRDTLPEIKSSLENPAVTSVVIENKKDKWIFSNGVDQFEATFQLDMSTGDYSGITSADFVGQDGDIVCVFIDGEVITDGVFIRIELESDKYPYHEVEFVGTFGAGGDQITGTYDGWSWDGSISGSFTAARSLSESRIGTEPFNPNPFFGDDAGPFDLSAFLPDFDECGNAIPGTVGYGLDPSPDATIGGIFPNFDQSDWDIDLEVCDTSGTEIYGTLSVPCFRDAGTMYVQAFNDVGWPNKAPDNRLGIQTIFADEFTEGMTYAIDYMPIGSDVFVSAWWDLNANGIFDPGELEDISPFFNTQSTPNLQDMTIGTSTGEDLDCDGMDDTWEEENGLNPFDPGDGIEDPDEDGLSNFDEFENETDPNNPDSDGDWLGDGEEFYGWSGPATDPTNPDSDGDKFSDGYEMNAGTDPNDVNDVPDTIPITGVIHNVQESDGSFRTYIEVLIENGFVGDLGTEIETIEVRGPGNELVASYPGDFTYLEQWRDFFANLDGSPTSLGTYSFEVRTTGGLTGIDTDYQYVLRTIPIPDPGTFSPADGATISSKTPVFSWDPVDLPGVALYYRLTINDDSGNRVYASRRQLGMTYHTVPENVLEAGKTYEWRVRVTDSPDWKTVENRANGEWQTVTMASPLTHGTRPALSPNDWNVLTYTTEYGSDVLCSVTVIDHDGVASDGSSHTVTVRLPDGTIEGPFNFDYLTSPTSGYYWYDIENLASSGTYTLTVTDPDGNTGTLVEDFTKASLDPIDTNSIAPSNVDHYITATFDNVNVKYTPAGDWEVYDEFNYSHIDELDMSKWGSWHPGMSINAGKLISTISNPIGRGHSGLAFIDANRLYGIQTEVTIDDISIDDGPPRARIAGYWFHNGTHNVWASLSVKGNRVYYAVDEDWINEEGNYQWGAPLAEGYLTPDGGINVGETITISVSWDGTALTFKAGTKTSTFTPDPAGNINPPTIEDKGIHTRINFFTSTAPTFTWDPVAGANRYRFRIYNYDNSRTVWRGVTGETSYTLPPGILKPNSYYRFRLEAWDTPSPLNIDNVSKTPGSNDDNYRFYTTDEEAVDPFIDPDAHAAVVWNNELMEPYLVFAVRVHDAQGVPENIASVTVTHPGGETEELEYRSDVGITPPTPTSGYYRLRSSIPYNPDQVETYTFTVIDNQGNTNSFPLTDDLSPDPIGYPAASSLNPVSNTVLGTTAVNFNWQHVPEVEAGQGYYQIEIYDHDFNRLYNFYTTENAYHLAVGFLKEKTFYRWRITTRREYFSDDVDNGSSSPAYFHDMPAFVTTPLADTDTDGLPDEWELDHWPRLNANDGQDDADNDGLSNRDEYLNGTDPNNPDSDNDGTPDGADPDPLYAGENGDTCSNDPDNDIDGDGVCGDVDNCPAVANSDQADLDGNGWGDVCDDIDGDYVNDDADQWPLDADNDIDADGYGADSFDNCLEVGADLTELALLCSTIDNCPGIANDQTDSDSDGIGDECDLAVGGAPPACHPKRNPCDPPIDDTPAEDDADGDGIPDVEDLCPDIHIDSDPNPAVTDPVTGSTNHLNTDGDGEGDVCDEDDDNDEILDDGDGSGSPTDNFCTGGITANCDDNCRIVENSPQSDLDCDGQGDVCDQDRDGDGLSDAEEINIGTSPTDADTDDDGWSDGSEIPIDCNNIYSPAITNANDETPLGTPPENSLKFEVLDGGGNDIYATWLPTLTWNYAEQKWDHDEIQLKVALVDSNGDPVTFDSIHLEIIPSTLEGVAVNDTEVYIGQPSNDFSFDPVDKTQLTLDTESGSSITVPVYVFDFGGRAVIEATATKADTSQVTGQIAIPLDSDNDTLPDEWEKDYPAFNKLNRNTFSTEQHDGIADIDTSLNNTYDGDGIPNFREYRGIILDLLDATDKIVYEFYRLDPHKKDLFARGDNFANSIPQNTTAGVLPFSVDHVAAYGSQSAFEEAGIKVWDVTGMPSFVREAEPGWEPPHIDILVVTNKTETNADGFIETLLGLENGYINHPSSLIPRYWTWDLKGASYIGNAQFYAIFQDEATGVTKRGTETYHLTLMHYFYNRPYMDEDIADDTFPTDPNWPTSSCYSGAYVGRLDPLDRVEDYYKENGTNPPDSRGKNKEDRCVAGNSVLDGDRMVPQWKTVKWGAPDLDFEAGYHLSAFDADADAMVENPVADDPAAIDSAFEYTAEQVQLHTVIHEMGHAVGMDEQHTSDPTCLMYEESINWSRAGHFSPYSQSQILIHNKTE